MSVNRALFSSARDDWETPPELFRLLDREFTFGLDVCATKRNHKCRRYLTPDQDGLRERWSGTCWMNPPYGRAIGAWIRKAHHQSLRGVTVVALVPARTDTLWWHQHAMKAREVRLLRGRLRFVGARASAPFPSAIVIFDKGRTPSPGPRVVGWDWRKRLST